MGDCESRIDPVHLLPRRSDRSACFYIEFKNANRDKQHLVNLLALGGLYAAVIEVKEALSPTTSHQRSILDLGKSFSIKRLRCLFVGLIASVM